MNVREMLPAMFMHTLYEAFCRTTIRVTLIEESAINFDLAQRSYRWVSGEGVRELTFEQHYGESTTFHHITPWSKRIEAICESRKRKEDGSYD